MNARELIEKMAMAIGPEMITGEQRAWFTDRTNRHIGLFNQYLGRLHDLHPELEIEAGHDASKFSEPELTPYILLTWDYRCRDTGDPWRMSQEQKQQAVEATYLHMKANRHHPEFWDPEAVINPESRDGIPNRVTQAQSMPVAAIGEMVCDWCAMSRERGGHPSEWFTQVNGTRFEFTNEQQEQIKQFIDELWT